MSAATLPAWPGPSQGATLRVALRPGASPGSVPNGDEPIVVRVDPLDGATGVFRDTPVIVSLSHPADPSTLVPETFRVEAGGVTEVPGQLSASPDGAVLIWVATRPLAPGVVHFVAITGVRDRRGQAIKAHVSRFVPCDIALADLMTPGAS